MNGCVGTPPDDIADLATMFCFPCFHVDLGRMYSLVSRVPTGMAELRKKFQSHVHSQGLSAIEKCGDSVVNVS